MLQCIAVAPNWIRTLFVLCGVWFSPSVSGHEASRRHTCVSRLYSVLQGVAACGSVVCCSVLQCGVLQCVAVWCVAVCCSVVFCSVLQCCVLQCVAVCRGAACCSVLQRVAVCCSVLPHEGTRATPLRGLRWAQILIERDSFTHVWHVM